MLTRISLTGLLVSTFAMSALGATLITFEDLGVAVGSQLNPSSGVGVVSYGFDYTPGPNNTSGLNDLHISNQEGYGPWNGSTNGRSHDDVILSKVGGGGFTLNQFDFAGWEGGEVAFSVVGYYVGGGSITQNFTPDGISDGPGGSADFQTFLVTGNWSNLSSVAWTHAGAGTVQGLFALDNILVDSSAAAVPEPSTFALMGLGGALLALVRRRRS